MQHVDVIIAGGGLAGLSLAHQLRAQIPDLEIVVVERNQFPVPEKTAKVGESTVEIGSRYLTHTLGLKQHFSERHLRKHGLRCFFGTPQSDFAEYDELGVSQLFGIPTYQIDRGAIENFLQQDVTRQGITVLDGASIKNLDISSSKKSVTVETNDGQRNFSCTWFVDAAGRQALLKNKLGLAKASAHKGNAVWFRVDRQIKLDEWTSNTDWQARTKQPNTRWLSTNHLMGPGYWVWIIPLDNGATSIGVVMDDEVFDNNDFSSLSTTMAWLQMHHPQCADAIEGAEVLDYVAIRDYSHECTQMFSEEGWGVTGESGVFADPFYSPGSDFIAFNNTFLTRLISDASRGENIQFQARLFERLNQSFFDSTLSLYAGEYGGFGDRRMMSLKLVWDYAYYWGVLSLLFFKEAMTDLPLMRELAPTLVGAQMTNQKVQAAFRERAKLRRVLPAQGLFANQYDVPFLRHLNTVLDDPKQGAREVLPTNVESLTRLAGYILEMLDESAKLTISDDERSLLGDYRRIVLA